MQKISKPLIACSLFIVLAGFKTDKTKPTAPKIAQQKIQVAILLDVSSSMDGLIDQAKAQLWNMVNTLGKVQCSNSATPQIEIALYEYGRSSNSVKDGYVKRINDFTTSLDSLSQNLFSLHTNGGDEYCGQVIYTSLQQLKWDESADNYKVIFIAGNEDFLQGKLHYITACNLAKQKGVIVNTIYCGSKQQGIAEHWNLQSECGNGTFTNIDANAKTEDIPTPYDSAIYSFNNKLNGTFVAYGAQASYNYSNVAIQDKLNVSNSKAAGIKRIKSKANAKVYKNSTWDLVDAKSDDKEFVKKLNKQQLPDSLKNKTTAEIEKIVDDKQKERAAIQQKIVELNKQRDEYIVKNTIKNTANTQTLETEIEKIIKTQVQKFKMTVQQ
jgi:hypothetical protein